MVGAMRRVLVCSPEAAGWATAKRRGRWRELGYSREPDAGAAEAQHEALRRELEAAGAEAISFQPGDELSLDAVYVHDPSFITNQGAILLRMGKACRLAEPAAHGRAYASLGVPVLGEISAPVSVEAGDLVWLDGTTVLAGRGYRTNAAGIEQLRALLAPLGVEVLIAPLPHSAGPASCLHLMSLLSLLDARTVLVDSPWLAVETVELLCGRGFKLIEIDSSERDTLACNVLALGERRLLAFAENPRTMARLREAGFDVRGVPGSELGINGGGGPTCLTRPLLRD
ncbi:MAG: dimethylarginine dimethylaminohydrolase family protein [Candidatus Acidiferrales bacterium]